MPSQRFGVNALGLFFAGIVSPSFSGTGAEPDQLHEFRKVQLSTDF